MRAKLKYGDRQFRVELINRDPLTIGIAGEDQDRELQLPGTVTPGRGRLQVDGRYLSYFVSESASSFWVNLGGQTFHFDKVKASAAGVDEHRSGFTTPMPGKIIEVPVSAGMRVAKGQVLVIMEAMKMEHRIEAPGDGVVTALHCKGGDVLEQGFKLLDFEAAEP